ncbi:MAG: hypothetical protein IK130_08080 [Oscillospiraceae bacterium]|nr:hypothetical protein [Oscillospiraceae bacterium]
MSETRFMQTVLFGGYERSAVEKRFERMLTQISDLKNELRETKLLYTELSNGEEAAAAAEKILAEERIKLTQAQVQAEKATKKLKATEEDLAARESEIAELKEKLAAQEEELREKTARLLGYESGSDSAALSQVFVAAQQSATQLIQNAKKEAADLEAKSQKLADNVVTEANNSAKQIIYEAEVQAAETVVNAENRLNQMETADANLRASLLADVESISERLAAMQAAFQSFQESGIATLTQSAEMLDTTKQELTAGGIPVFREPVQIGLRLPAEPVLDPVDHNYDAPAEDPAVKQQQAEELARLQAMAAALSGKKPDADAGSARTKTPVVEYADPAQRPVVTTEAASAEPAKAADATSALAALAAQAEAIAGKKGSSSSGAAAGGNDLAALAAQAAALKKKK